MIRSAYRRRPTLPRCQCRTNDEPFGTCRVDEPRRSLSVRLGTPTDCRSQGDERGLVSAISRCARAANALSQHPLMPHVGDRYTAKDPYRSDDDRQQRDAGSATGAAGQSADPFAFVAMTWPDQSRNSATFGWSEYRASSARTRPMRTSIRAELTSLAPSTACAAM